MPRRRGAADPLVHDDHPRARSHPDRGEAEDQVRRQDVHEVLLPQFNRSQTEPNPTLLRPLYLDACEPCVAYTAGAQALKDNCQRYDDPPFRIGTKVTADTFKDERRR